MSGSSAADRPHVVRGLPARTLALLLLAALSLAGCGDRDAASATLTAVRRVSSGGVQQATPTASRFAGPTPSARTAATVAPPTFSATTPTALILPATATVPEPPTPTATVTATFVPTSTNTPTPPPTSTPTPLTNGPLTAVYDETFDDLTTLRFYTGHTDPGADLTAGDGQYRITRYDVGWQNSSVDGDDVRLADGVVTAEAAIDGQGAAGVVARETRNDDNTYSFYVCWLNSAGAAGCHLHQAGNWVALFRAPDGTITLQPFNQLALRVVGDELSFQVNGVAIGTTHDSTVQQGRWGVYGQCDSGTTTARFDRVTIYSASPGNV